MNNKGNRKLAAILFADIVGYTSLMQADEAHTFQIIKRYQYLLQTAAQEFNGQVLKNYGDGSLMTFSNSVDAVKAAKQIQEQSKIEPTVPLRIGIHVGEFIVEKNDIFGNGVNLASRIESLGIEGAVFFSKNIFQKIKNHPEFKVQALGRFEFKNVEESMEVFALANEGFPIPKRREIKGKLKTPNQKPNKKRLVLFIGTLMLLSTLLFLFFNSRTEQKEKIYTPTKNALAVLPLISLNQKSEDLEYFSDGITQEVIDELAKVKSFKISAFSQSLFYKNQNKSPKEIAKELNVQYLVAGTCRVFEKAQKVKISIELLNPFTNERLWNGSFEQDMQNASVLQLNIAKKIVASLNIELSNEEMIALNKVNTTNGDAFRLFLEAKAEMNKFNEEAFKKSRALLNKAIELDPNYSQAYTLYAWSLMLSGDPQIVPNTVSSSESLALMEPIIEKSIALNPKNSDAFLVRSAINLYGKNRIGDAKKDIEKALELKSWPHVPTNYCTCTIVSTFVASRDVVRAKKAAKLSQEVDPGNILVSWDKANIYMVEGDYDTAQRLYKDAADKIDDSFFNTFLGWSYYHGGKFEKALKHLQKGHNQTELPIAMNIAYLSNVHYALGNLKESEQFFNKLLERDATGEHHMNMHLAMVYAARKNKELTLKYIQKAFDKNEYGLAVMSNLDPIFKFLYQEPIFINVREEMQFRK